MNTIRDIFLLIFIAVGPFYPNQAQQFVNFDHNYLESIHSTQIYIPGLQIFPPFVQLKDSSPKTTTNFSNQQTNAFDSLQRDPANPADYYPEKFYSDRDGRFGTSSNTLNRGTVRLSFDELGAETRYMYYKIEHCNSNWTRSDLEDYEYLTSINEQRVKNYEFSFNTQIPYVHYWVNLPNEDQSWTKSGNYLVHVYDQDSGEPILTKRLVVFEEEVSIKMQLVRPFQVQDINTHHEIKFEIDATNTELKDQLNTIRVSILQNARWNEALLDLKPSHYAGRTIYFNNLDVYKFPAGKEFRHFDIRSLDYASRQVSEISKGFDGAEVKLMPDEPRGISKFWSDSDLNGSFFIQSLDNYDSAVSADYAHILFSLKSAQPIFDGQVYLVGGFSNWEILDQFKMEYAERYSAYFGEATLKQGVYDYLYAVVRGQVNERDYELLEGNWHETENFYTILVYYRPFGQRYDRVIGIEALSQK